jgi:hypothetical protein
MQVELQSGITSGALKVKVQAANMTDPVVELQRVRITIRDVSALAKAEQLVNKLVNMNGFVAIRRSGNLAQSKWLRG